MSLLFIGLGLYTNSYLLTANVRCVKETLVIKLDLVAVALKGSSSNATDYNCQQTLWAAVSRVPCRVILLKSLHKVILFGDA